MKVFNDDDELNDATQTQDVSSGDKGSSSRTDRIKAKIINKSEAPLEKTKFKVMLELLGNERPGLDLVTVLDRSMSMKGEKLDKMKLAMQLVIKKLSPIDRLSVVTFCGNAKRLCPLRQMTENSQEEIEKLVNNLVARGKTNIYAGLKKGLRVLKDRRFTSERVVAIMLLSDGPQNQYIDVPVDSVPVYTFGLGADYDTKVLNAIADNSRGGTFTDVRNEDYLSIAFSQCLDGLLTVTVQDLKVTFTKGNSIIENVTAGDYPKSRDGDSVTVSLGALCQKELRKVIVDLLLPAVSSPQKGTDVLQISYSYSIGEELVEGIPICSSVDRVKTSKEPEREELKSEEICNKTVQSIKKAREKADGRKLGDAKEKIGEAQRWLEDEVDEPKQLIEMLKYELQQLLNLMQTKDIYDNLGHSFALSCEKSHDLQRFAAKDPSSRTKVRIVNKTEAPLEETKFKAMLELMGNESGSQSPGLDLVMVLDVSGSMHEEMIKKMKSAMQLVLERLRPIDRLSVVTFCTDSKSLCPLCHIDEKSKAGIEKLVDYLQAQDQGPGDISAGLEMGLKVLNYRTYTSGRVVAIMLLSDGGQNLEVELEAYNVPIFTFGLGSDPTLLQSIADNSSGGTFTNVQNLDNLKEEVSKCLTGLLTVAVHDLKVTFTQVDSAIKNVNVYPQDRDDKAGSVIVSSGNLDKKALQNFNVDLLLPRVSSTQCADILKISYTYSFGGERIHTNPLIVTIVRRNSVPMINETRVLKVKEKQLEVAHKMISVAQQLPQNVVNETLNSEVQQLKRLMNSQLNNQQESAEVIIDEIHLLTAESRKGTNSLQASSVHSNNDVKKFAIEFLLDPTVVRKRIPESLNRSNNYTDWSEKVKQYLEELKVWKVIEEPSIEITESIENVDRPTAIKTLRQFRENWMALILINQACGFPINLQIIDLHSARTAWETLARNWKQGGPDVERFLSAVERGKWKNAERLLDSSPSRGLATARIPSSQNTVLHLASLSGEVNIVKKLVRLMTEEDLEIQDKDGYTALTKASINGNKRIAQCMVEKNRRLVSIPTGTKLLPVVIAMMYGNKEMTTYLYSKTPPEDLTNNGNINGATLLTYSLKGQFYDISIRLIKKYPRLAVALDHNGQSAMYQLACTPSAFRSGNKLKFWEKWMYYCVTVQDIDWDDNETRLCVPDEDVSQSNWWNAGYRGIWQQIASRLLAVLGIKRIYEMKLVHHQSTSLLRRICEQITDDLDNNEINGIINALHEAAAGGVVEFVDEVLKKFPEFRWLSDKEGSTIFMKAVQFRHAEVFCLIHDFPSQDKMVVLEDICGENIFHKLQYSSVDKISTIQGGLKKMQKELEWFEEIESMMPPDSLKKENIKRKTAQQLIDKSHKRLISNAERVMKDTANSCIIVGILVVTIMFAAAFTVPGGNNQDTGLPIFLKKKLFKIFIISDAVSLCFSTVSVVMFLGILTSRYAEKDFLKHLPRKLIIAIFALFISLTAMMIAFTATLFIMLRREFWISIPITVILTSPPVIIFAILFFPVLYECFRSTYGPSIFPRRKQIVVNG